MSKPSPVEAELDDDGCVVAFCCQDTVADGWGDDEEAARVAEAEAEVQRRDAEETP